MARPKRSLAKLRRDPAAAAVLLAAAPLLIGGAVALTMALAGDRSPLSAWFTSTFRGGSRTRSMRELLRRYARGEQPFSSLRQAVIGSAKGAVLTVFGRPRTAMLGRGASKLSIWRADTWYYPLDRADRSAIAIRFQGNVARDVERISVPTAMTE